MAASIREAHVDLERQLEKRTAQLGRAIAHQTAISEILSLMAASPTDVQPVLNAVAERAAALCNATYARILVIDGAIRNADRGGEPAGAPDSHLDPDAIARSYRDLLRQDRSAWTSELELRPWVERF